MSYEGYDYHGSSFEQAYRCYPPSFIDKPQLECGDKVIMPPSALNRLASLHIDYPMLFELFNAFSSQVSHCGVLEFTAEEGMIYMPYWMMENLLLQEGDIIHVKSATLLKGTYVKLQPHTKDFLDTSNPKAILETSLRSFTCLTTGDRIMVAYNNKKYYIDIVETKPSHAVSIIETDCEVDFAPALDYKEPETHKNPVPASKAPVQVDEAETEAEDASRFTPFAGVGRRLDGKAPKGGAPLTLPPANDLKSNAVNSMKRSAPFTLRSSSSCRAKRKRIFGSSSSPDSIGTKKAGPTETKEEQPTKMEESKFQAFTGKKYSLRG